MKTLLTVTAALCLSGASAWAQLDEESGPATVGGKAVAGASSAQGWSLSTAADPGMEKESRERLELIFKQSKKAVAKKYGLPPQVDFGYLHASFGAILYCSSGKLEENGDSPANASECLEYPEDLDKPLPKAERGTVSAGNGIWQFADEGESWNLQIQWVLLHELGHIAKRHTAKDYQLSMSQCRQWFVKHLQDLKGNIARRNEFKKWLRSSDKDRMAWFHGECRQKFLYVDVPVIEPYGREYLKAMKREEREADDVANELMISWGYGAEAAKAAGKMAKFAGRDGKVLPHSIGGDPSHDGWLIRQMAIIFKDGEATLDEVSRP